MSFHIVFTFYPSRQRRRLIGVINTDANPDLHVRDRSGYGKMMRIRPAIRILRLWSTFFLSFARHRLQRPQLRIWKRCSCLARSLTSRAPAAACPWPGPGAPASSSPGRPSGAPVLLPVFIPGPTFIHPGPDFFPSRGTFFHPGSASKNLTPTNGF